MCGWVLGGLVCRRVDVDNLHGQALCSELGWWYATARGRLRVERESVIRSRSVKVQIPSLVNRCKF